MARQTSFKLKYQDLVYQPELSEGVLTPAEMKAEYTRIRNVGMKRLKALQRSEFADSKAATRGAVIFSRTPSTLSPSELKWALYDAYKWITAKASSVTGQQEIRRKAIETLHKHNYDFINKRNFKRFTDFMEANRQKYKGRLYDSGDAATYYSEHAKEIKKMSPEELEKAFEIYLENLQKERAEGIIVNVKSQPSQPNGDTGSAAGQLPAAVKKRKPQKRKSGRNRPKKNI